MSYPLLSALGELDSSLQAAEAQLAKLRAALPLDEASLQRAFQEVCGQASALADLIRRERPQAQWDDREALGALVFELEEAAEEKLDQQCRARLLDLADELEAGQVRHRFAARTAQLNALRLDGVRELRSQAALAGKAKDLPGPAACIWLNWAFNLQDDQDEAVIRQLRANFASLENFTGEMEEMYWVPSPRARSQAAAPPTPPETAAPASSMPRASAPGGQQAHPDGSHPDPLRDRIVNAMHAGSLSEVLSLAYERAAPQPFAPETASPGEAASRRESTTATLPAERAVRSPSPAPQVERCERCGTILTGDVHSCSSNGSALAVGGETIPPLAEPAAQSAAAPMAAATPERSHVSPEAAPLSAPAGEAAAEPIATESARFEGSHEERPSEAQELPAAAEVVASRKRLAWVGAGSFVVLSVLFFTILHHLHARPGNKPGPTVQAAGIETTPASSPADTSPESAPPPADNPNAKAPEVAAAEAGSNVRLLHRQSAEGPQASIGLSVEFCDRGKPGSIECWGYVSNLSGANSRVSLDRVDVVDGRGNSFSLDRNGQFAFPSGPSSTIPAGSRVKYTLKVPDKDVDARTLTLYMDLSNPRSLEYTFRDVPIAQ